MGQALVEVRSELIARRVDLADILPPSVSPDRIIRIATRACEMTPKLVQADRSSFMQSVITACVLGLEPDGVLGLAALVPFRGKVQLIPMIRGLVTLAAQASYALKGVAVAKHDMFSYQEGTNPFINHAPPELGQDRGKIVGAYAVARSNHLPHEQHVMSIREILDVRNQSAGYRYAIENGKKDNPWLTHPKPMIVKTPGRALGSKLPFRAAEKLVTAARMDEIHDAGHTVTIDPTGDLTIDGETTIRSNEL